MPDRYDDRKRNSFRRDSRGPRDNRQGGGGYNRDNRQGGGFNRGGGNENRGDRRDRFMKKAKKEVSEAYKASAQDHSIIQAINAYNEIEKARNIIYERLEEWYGGYFPNVRLANHETYSKLISKVANKNVTAEDIQELFGDSTEKMLHSIKSDSGFPEMDAEEHIAIKELAQTDLSLVALQSALDKFLAVQTKNLMPNVVFLIDYKIAAEMLAKAGSIQRMATMPASTIQLLGAERALFKHLKFGGRPPKYGYLFKLPELATADKKEKGRMARIYATKIGIAARADAYTRRFIADKLKEQIEKARKGRRAHSTEPSPLI